MISSVNLVKNCSYQNSLIKLITSKSVCVSPAWPTMLTFPEVSPSAESLLPSRAALHSVLTTLTPVVSGEPGAFLGHFLP